MKLEDKIAASEDVVAREVGGETVLLDLASGLYFGLGEVGGMVWALLSEKAQSIAALCDAIEAEFDAPRGTIEADIIALADDLADKNLISAVDG